jgi:hypothetical protein
VLLAKQDIRRVIDELPEPTKSIVMLMVVGSLRIGEVIVLRWERIHSDRIEIVESFYEGEFDDTKTDADRRSIPLDLSRDSAGSWRTQPGKDRSIEGRMLWFLPMQGVAV